MGYALTVKSQVTIPKAIRQHLKVAPGQEVEYEPLPDGSVRMTAAVPEKRDVEDIRAALRKWRGTGLLKQSTEEIMRFTRGEDAMR
ncbi:AbrB/MazE/SpoVT family DNA-binding domain-containing protein [Xylophilus ampelinus]|uniref:AbrB family transcriptional regulator n=1 Tax=Xylophilus ampelinus TaxID=54067 RepID=A0A318SK02_9BURK|nr:AbrB/MazE/SpoVT family DNA-binding domain-containing protein [Xylophilus ampelinus]MCS4509515.1 type II toxin-antitoxin system PrlF family antitoxin [Xylophilus ampelinus]PYE79245.1 AbrB family transcriptional regulator [Xylophilus ampelinus]